VVWRTVSVGRSRGGVHGRRWRRRRVVARGGGLDARRSRRGALSAGHDHRRGSDLGAKLDARRSHRGALSAGHDHRPGSGLGAKLDARRSRRGAHSAGLDLRRTVSRLVLAASWVAVLRLVPGDQALPAADAAGAVTHVVLGGEAAEAEVTLGLRGRVAVLATPLPRRLDRRGPTVAASLVLAPWLLVAVGVHSWSAGDAVDLRAGAEAGGHRPASGGGLRRRRSGPGGRGGRGSGDIAVRARGGRLTFGPRPAVLAARAQVQVAGGRGGGHDREGGEA
jgi:hypothetical protein